MSKINLINKYIDGEQLDAYKNLGINRKEIVKYVSFSKPVSKRVIKNNSRDQEYNRDQEEGYKRNTKKYDSYGNLKTIRFNNRDEFKL